MCDKDGKRNNRECALRCRRLSTALRGSECVCMKSFRRTFAIFCFLALLIPTLFSLGCSAKISKPPSPDVMLNEAKEIFQAENYSEVITETTDLLEEYPDSKERVEALLLLADSHYFIEEYDEAKFHYKSFTELYPAHPKSDYALYQQALSDYQLMDLPTRDQSFTQNALKGFQKLIDERPGSPFYKKALAKGGKYDFGPSSQ